MTPGRRVVLGPGCEAVRAAAGPLAWVVLEDLALVAEVEPSTGRVIAHTSAARIAGRVGLTKGAAARALQQLRAVKLVVLDRPLVDRGRFDGSAYRVLPVDGLHLESAPHVDPLTNCGLTVAGRTGGGRSGGGQTRQGRRLCRPAAFGRRSAC